jgi:hypothetical protein
MSGPTLAVSLFAAPSSNWIVSTTVLGLGVGVAQWFVLRGRVPRSTLWLLAVPAAGLVSGAVVRAVVRAAPDGFTHGLGALLGPLGELTYAVLSGGALAYMARGANRI